MNREKPDDDRLKLPAVTETEQRFREMIDALPAAIYTTDSEGRLTHFNPAAAEMAGRTPDLGTDNWCVSWKLFWPDGTPLPHDQCPMAIALKEGRVLNGVELIVERPDGKRIWITPYPRAVRDADGKIVGGVNMLLDITERKRAEEATNLIAAIVTSSDDAIISKDLNGTITSWNDGANHLFGYTADEAIGRNITLIIPSDRRDEEAQILARLRNDERVDHFQTVRIRKDGSVLDVSLTISPVKDSLGRVVGASKVARDITAQRRAEQALRESEERFRAASAKFRAVFEQTTVFAGIMTIDGVVIDANKLSLEGCGYNADEVLGRLFWETGWWRDFQQSRDKIRDAIPLAAQGMPYRETLHYSWADGTERLVDFALFPIVDDDGHILFLHPTGVDITDLKRAEERYRQLAESLDAEVIARTRELEERNAEVERQSDQVRALSGQLLQAQDEERRHIARELHDSAGQSLTLLGMNLARFVQETSQIAPQLTPQAEEIRELVRRLNQEIRTTSYLLHPPLLDESGLASALKWYTEGLSERSDLKISLDVPADLGRLPRDIEMAIFRLVQECLTNIHRHSSSRNAAIRVTYEADIVTMEVQDQGKGIAAGKLAEIQLRGSGLGIRGMRERVRQLQGTFRIESDSTGTRVRATIPCPRATEPEEQRGIERLQTTG